ncbi:MAG TPA: 5-(carboxyamino)imidazole ribonucleotide mutase [Candidatus Paceibacterota bacterium]
MKNATVGIIMGSDSDLEVMAEAAKVLEEFGIAYEMTVASAHRAPNLVHKFITNAPSRGMKIVIAGAGGSFHLAGVLAAISPLPVIALPVKAKSLDGLDSLLSAVNMPPGVPVATVGINAGKNAGLLAVQMLAISDRSLEDKMIAYKLQLEEDNRKKGEKLEEIGYKKYLASPVDELRPREK